MASLNILKTATNPPKQISGNNSLSWKVVDESLLSPIKAMVKCGDASLQSEFFHYLSTDLTKTNGIVRYRALVVVDCLFMRSSGFRKITSANIRMIAKAGDLLKTENSVKSISIERCYLVELESKVKELIELWDMLYGMHLPPLRAMARYFRESLRLDMPNIMIRAQKYKEKVEERLMQEKCAIVLRQTRILEVEMPGKFEDYLLSLQKLDECFSVLFPSVLDSEDAKTSTEDNEATATGAAVAAAANISETMNDENDDCEDVDWIDENENEVTVGSIYENEFEFSSGSGVPYALEIVLSASASGLPEDDSVVKEIIREITKYLTTHVLPILTNWDEGINAALDIYNEELEQLATNQTYNGVLCHVEHDRTSGRATPHRKRPRLSAHSGSGNVVDSHSNSNSSSSTYGADYTVDTYHRMVLDATQEIALAQQKVANLIQSIRYRTDGKCKSLLS